MAPLSFARLLRASRTTYFVVGVCFFFPLTGAPGADAIPKPGVTSTPTNVPPQQCELIGDCSKTVDLEVLFIPLVKSADKEGTSCLPNPGTVITYAVVNPIVLDKVGECAARVCDDVIFEVTFSCGELAPGADCSVARGNLMNILTQRLNEAAETALGPGQFCANILGTGNNNFIQISATFEFDCCVSSPEFGLPQGQSYPLLPDCKVSNMCNGIIGDEKQLFVSGFLLRKTLGECPPPATPSPTETMAPPSPTATFTPQPPTATPTNTHTREAPTPTATRTPLEPTATATPTATHTPLAPTATATPTATEQPSATPSSEPTATATVTDTPPAPTSTATPTPELSSTPTPSVSPSETPSPLASPTATPSESFTATPTETPTSGTPTSTATPTESHSPTSSPTPSLTPSSSPTPEAPTATPSVSETPASSPTPLATATSTLEPTETPSPTPSPTIPVVCDSGYYLLDSMGGRHRVGEPITISGSVYFGRDIARDMERAVCDVEDTTNEDLVVLDGYGAAHFVQQPECNIMQSFYFDPVTDTKGFPQGRAIDIEMSADFRGFWVLTDFGGIYRAGSVKDATEEALVPNTDLTGILGFDIPTSLLSRDPDLPDPGGATLRAVSLVVIDTDRDSRAEGYIVMNSMGGRGHYHADGSLVPAGMYAGAPDDDPLKLLDPEAYVWPFFSGLDIARDMELHRTGRGVVILDGWDGIHPVPVDRPTNPVFFARNEMSLQDPTPVQMVGMPYIWLGFNDPQTPENEADAEVFGIDAASIFRDLEFAAGCENGLYTLEAFGGVFVMGDARPLEEEPIPQFGNSPYFFPFQYAEDMEVFGHDEMDPP